MTPMDPDLLALALAIADAPRPTTSAAPVLPEPSFTARTAEEWADDLATIFTLAPVLNRAQRRAAAGQKRR